MPPTGTWSQPFPRKFMFMLKLVSWDLLHNNTQIAHQRRAVTLVRTLSDNEEVPKINQLSEKKKKRRWGFSSLAVDKTRFGRILFPGEFSRGYGPSRSNEDLDGISILLVFYLFLFLS